MELWVHMENMFVEQGMLGSLTTSASQKIAMETFRSIVDHLLMLPKTKDAGKFYNVVNVTK